LETDDFEGATLANGRTPWWSYL